jgi:hypothetical protein
VRSPAQTAGTTAMNSRTLTCTKCGKTGHVGAMARWHGWKGERCRPRGDQRKKGPLPHERRVEIGRLGGRKWAAMVRERREAAGLPPKPPRAPKGRRPKLKVTPRMPPMVKRARGRPGKAYVVTNPEGQSFPITNLERFCRERGLSHRFMVVSVRSDGVKAWNGWTARYASVWNQVRKFSDTYRHGS